jgi:hypothetical protein
MAVPPTDERAPAGDGHPPAGSSDEVLTAFQMELTRMFFALPSSQRFLLAGGAALLAQRLTVRPTQDLDLFTRQQGDVRRAREELTIEVARRGWTVEVHQDTEDFCRLLVHGPEDLLVDLALESPPTLPATVSFIGPTFAPQELAGRKLLALFDRAAARDFADVYVLAQRYGKAVLLERAHAIDTGLDHDVLATYMHTLSRFTDDELPVARADLAPMRAFFTAWANELTAPGA